MELNYQAAIEALFARISHRREDLKVMESLLEKMGNPQRAFPSVHIAGTNGKGSVSTKLASALQSAGYRVGLYTSPHITAFEERITINGMKIPQERVLEYYAGIEESSNPNFFEVATCICFQYFKDEKVDIGIIETGLGGTLDSTNVITPILSIITSIGLDHTEYLGDTIEKIAEQKAGIIKPDIPVVLGPRARFAPILQKASSVCAPVFSIHETAPFYDLENQATARASLAILASQFTLSANDIELGLKARPPCRFERRGDFIFDVAHNPAGFARLKEALETEFPGQSFRFVIGMSRRKDIKGCLQEIENRASHIHFVESGREDAATASELKNALQAISSCPCSLETSVEAGIENAKSAAQNGAIIVVCGSFYIMEQALMHTELESQTLV